MTTQPTPPTAEQAILTARRDRLARHLRTTAGTLSRLAAEAAAIAHQVECGRVPGGATHIDVVADLAQEILSGLPNLHLGTIARAAAEADQAVIAAAKETIQ